MSLKTFQSRFQEAEIGKWRRNMSKRLSFQFAVLSFLPLWLSALVVCLQSIVLGEQPIWTEIAMLFLVPAMILFAGFEVWRAFHSEPFPDEIDSALVVQCEKQRTVTTEFLLACVLPLYTFDFTKWCSVVQFALVIGSILFLYAKHYGCPPNVVLEFFGVSCFKCQFDDGKERFVLARNIDLTDGKIYMRSVSDSVFIRRENNAS